MDAGNIITGNGDAGVTVNFAGTMTTGVPVLQPGQYSVRVVAATNGDVSTVELLDANGAALTIDQDGTAGAGATGTISTARDMSTGTTTFNFGNGVSIGLNAITADGTYTAAFTLKDNGSAYNLTSLGGTTVGSTWLDTNSGTTLTAEALGTAQSYSNLMTYLESKLDTVNAQMAKLGAFTGRLTFKEDQVMASQINVEASYNRIMNANMAEEQVNASKFLILQQTSIAMLGQANQAPQFLLSLFR
jgi:flagellin